MSCNSQGEIAAAVTAIGTFSCADFAGESPRDLYTNAGPDGT